MLDKSNKKLVSLIKTIHKTEDKIKMCKKNLLLIIFAFLSFLISSNNTMAEPQKDLDYSLAFMFNSAHFYNIEKHNNEIYIGSNKGIYRFRYPNKIELIDETKTGYVYFINDKITCLNYFKIGYQTPFYNSLLPKGYKNQSIVGASLNDCILITSNSKLFLFHKKIAKLADSLSIRSITNNYLGTYSGVFHKNVKIPYPPFCNGYIKEFDGETIICFDGIVRLFKDGKSEIYETNKEFQKAFGIDSPGSFRDAIKIDNQNYILATTTGILLTNFKGSSRWIIKGNTDSNPRIIEAKFNKSKNNSFELLFTFKNKIYEYHLSNNSLIKRFEISSTYGSIMDIAYEELARVYVITEDKLLLVQKHSDNTYTEEVLQSNLIGNHQLIWLENYLLLTSNMGLSAFDTFTGKFKLHIIQDEFNDKAYNLTKDSTFLGTISGYYALSNKRLKSLIEANDQNANYEEINTSNTSYFYPFIFTCLLALLFLGLLIYYKTRAQSKSDSLKNSKTLTKESLKEYIQNNLASASITSITEHFQTNLHVINKMLGDMQLGELIRSLRLEKVQKMRKNNRKEEEISFVTGFSLSYLKKIKT
mgnify:CR=1 FL=1